MFAKGCKFACAFVENDTAYVTGVDNDQQAIYMFVSTDLENWQHRVALGRHRREEAGRRERCAQDTCLH